MGIYFLCLVFTYIVGELLRISIWGKYRINKKRITEYVLFYILSAVVFYIAYIGADFSMSIFDSKLSMENIRLTLYVGMCFHIIRVLLLYRKDLKHLLSLETFPKYLCCLAIITGIVLILELTIFNFRHFQSALFHPIYPQEFVVSDNLSICDAAAYEVMADGDTYIEINGINEEVNSIHADYIFPQKGEYGVVEVKYHYSVIDQGNAASYYDLPGRTFLHLIPQTQYTHVNLYGDCISLRVNFDNLKVGDIIAIRSFVLNDRYPFMISIKRSIFLIFVIYLLFLLRPKSSLYLIKYLDQFKWKKVVLIAYFVFQAFFFWKIVNYNSFFVNMREYTGLQYQYLTESLVEGRTYLDREVPKSIIDLSDPYDVSMRQAVLRDGEDCPYDVGYYDGHYYVYFGIGPVILFFLPYYLLTGSHMPTYIALYLSALMIIISVMGLLSQIIKRWFSKIPLLIYLMFTCLFVNGCGLLYAMQRPDFYSLPIILALASSLGGLYFWMSAIENEKVSAWRLCVGSFCMAFVAACRPQFLIGSFLAIFIFWDTTMRERKLLSKKSIYNTLCFALPYIVIAAGVMFYNVIRFGSVFDFGANYNLTYNNMPYRGWRLDRLLYSVVGMLFIPSGVTNYFPYLEPSHYVSTYQGISVDEALLGGVIINQIYLLPTLLVFKFKNYFKNITAYRIAFISVVFALIIMIVDGQMAGVLTRYYSDFTWLLMISAFLIMAGIYQKMENANHLYCFKCLFYGCFIYSMMNRLLSIFVDAGLSLKDTNAMVFYRVAHLVEFWK